MSYTLKYTGEDIDDILDRAVAGGEIDDNIASRAPLASPALAGTPTAPTAAAGTDTTQIATTAFVQASMRGMIFQDADGYLYVND